MLNGSVRDIPTGGTAPELEAMPYPARLISLVDIGKQDGKFGIKHQYVATFELPTESYEEEDTGETRTRILSAFYNVPKRYSEKSDLVKFCAVMDKTPDDTYADYLGRACMVNVEVNDGKPRIKGVTKLGKGMDVAEATKETTLVTDEAWGNLDNIDIPNWIKELIQEKRVK